MNAEQIEQKIQRFYDDMNTLLDKNEFTAEQFEAQFDRISEEIKELKSQLESQQKKLADEAKYLDESDIQRIYIEKGGKEPTAYASGIKGDAAGLEGYFNHFITDGNLKSQVVFVNQDKHWMTVRLEKTDRGIIYQVADSMPENPTHDKTNREERIDALLLGNGCKKITFESEKQQNGHDCGEFAAKNAGLMKQAFDTTRKEFGTENVVPQASVKVDKPQTIETLSLKLEKYLDGNDEKKIMKTINAIHKLNDSKSSNISMTKPPQGRLTRQASVIQHGIKEPSQGVDVFL